MDMEEDYDDEIKPNSSDVYVSNRGAGSASTSAMEHENKYVPPSCFTPVKQETRPAPMSDKEISAAASLAFLAMGENDDDVISDDVDSDDVTMGSIPISKLTNFNPSTHVKSLPLHESFVWESPNH